MRTAGQKQLWAFGADILPRKNVGQFNQALMELGSGLCVPRQPRCLLCPVADLCPTRAAGLQEVIPASPRKLRYEEVHETAVVVRRRGRVLLRRCAEGERWSGLWDFPRFQVKPGQQGVGGEIIGHVKRLTGVLVALDKKLSTIKHGVTRFRITLTCQLADYVSGRLRKRDDLRWMQLEELGDLPLSVTGRKIAVKLCHAGMAEKARLAKATKRRTDWPIRKPALPWRVDSPRMGNPVESPRTDGLPIRWAVNWQWNGFPRIGQSVLRTTIDQTPAHSLQANRMRLDFARFVSGRYQQCRDF